MSPFPCISKLLRRQRTIGSAAALPPRGGSAPVLGSVALGQLTACLQQRPDATLAELGVALRAAGGPSVSRATLALAVVKLGWRRKDRPRRRARQCPRRSPARRVCRSRLGVGLHPFPLRGRDQYESDLPAALRARSRRGAVRPVPLHNGANVTLVAALTPHGLQAAMTVDGALNAAVFAAYLDQVLGPTLRPGDVVVLDNLPVHKAAGLAKVVEKRGARLLFLPPYSPDFNPIELAISKLKTCLRTAAARSRQALDDALAHISETDAQNWFDHCGYHIH